MPASFPTSIKSFSARTNTDILDASHVNDLQDEVAAIETGLRNGLALTVLPDATNTRDLGATATRWKDLFLSGVLALGGGQIAFPATQAPSADANTLDDYEEGTWTPSLGGSATYTAVSGVYTKIGRKVHVYGFVQVNAIGTGSTSVISGLPFASSTTFMGVVSSYAGSATSYASIGCFTSGSTIQLTAVAAAGAASTTLSPTVFQNGATVHFAVTYYI